MATLIDFQFMQTESGYILKEIAIIDTDMRISNYIIKPPFHYSQLTHRERKQLKWIQCNYSNLSWASGEYAFESIEKILTQELGKSTKIYVKGNEKKKLLEKYSIYAINMEDLGYKSQIRNLEAGISCRFHRGVCAMRNVYLMMNWMKNNFFK